MPIKNFSSIGGFAVGSTEVVNTEFALKNISQMHMISDHFTDANRDVYIMKRQTDAANNTMQLSLDGGTPLATNTPPLANDSVAFISARVFGQETTNNEYVYAAVMEVLVATNGSGVPSVVSSFEETIRNNPPAQEEWSVTADAFQIGSAPFFSFEVESVTTSSTVTWIGIVDITVVS
tara:strand:+ start:69 stop:602 length:534 start_codon:yes stop_codon:yes gene_type:complete